MKVQLQKMTESEFSHYSTFSYENYVSDYAIHANISIEKAKEKTGNGDIKRTKNDLWYLAKVDEQIIGFFWIQIYPDKNDSFGYDIFLDETYRGKGHGRQVMEQGKELLSAHRISKLRVSVFKDNLIAKSLYDSLGFYVVETNEQAQTFRMQIDL
jgi:ribosomal protein S18 acetylase RimI-like enzyme